jgi:outer membrane protein OmpA-like peptidoglycan-associated protein
MRNTNLFIATALSGALLLSAPAQAFGPLGGLGGGLGASLGGGLGGGLGGVTGSVDGSVGGRLGPQSDLDAADKARADAEQARAGARAAARRPAIITDRDLDAAATGATRVVRRGASVTVALPASVVAAAPVVGLAPPQVRILRERQTAAFIDGGVEVLSEPASYVYMDRQAEALRHDLEGTGVEVTRQGEDIVLEMPGDVTFAFDKADIRERFYPVLTAVAHTLHQFPATYVDVIGHTDAIGSAAYNQALSERRAASVAQFIEARDNVPAPLYVAGRGKSEPIASNATIEGRAANRRVEILLHPYVRD